MNIYVTGFHRAGTHEAAEVKAAELGLPYIHEGMFRWDDLQTAIKFSEGLWPLYDEQTGQLVGYVPDARLNNGFVCQCPMLAHKTLELLNYGEVHWCDRDDLALATSMKNGGFNEMLWDIMKTFREEFPEDKVWTKLTYDGREDRHYGFVQYATILTKAKKYLYKKHFKGLVTEVKLEDQPYYDETKTSADKHPLSVKAKQLYDAEKIKDIK